MGCGLHLAGWLGHNLHRPALKQQKYVSAVAGEKCINTQRFYYMHDKNELSKMQAHRNDAEMQRGVI